MATVTAFVRTTRKKSDKVHIRFRLRDGRNIQLFHKSEIEVNPALWDSAKQEIKAKVVCDADERMRIATKVPARKKLMLEIYNAAGNKDILTSDWLDIEVDKRLNPEKYNLNERPQTFFEAFEEFLEKRKLSEWRIRAFQVVIRTLKRYELYAQATQDDSFTLSFDGITPLVLRDIEEFLRNEHSSADEYPEIYEAVPESRKPQPRGQNTINGILTKVRSFYIWANDVGKTANNPFKNYTVEECIYGTPFYITIDERNKLHNTNLSRHPNLAKQRDIFVFQCLIGCRVGDLYKMRRENVINGAIEYVPRKTRDGHPVTVRVPLNSIAKEILEKYKDCGDTLFPFTSQQRYNIDIKTIFLASRLRRPVTVINPTTREPEVKPLNEIASSHLARRCFVGNLYKQVKDPNLVGALSGHRDGSRAFARYREIDEQMKTELVKLLE